MTDRDWDDPPVRARRKHRKKPRVNAEFPDVRRMLQRRSLLQLEIDMINAQLDLIVPVKKSHHDLWLRRLAVGKGDGQ